MFCAATGLGGTTQRVVSDKATVSKRTITVGFDTNVAPNLPWRFEPEQQAVTVHLGEQTLVYFLAENLSDQAIVGHATFNVTPLQMGIYFNKIQCFCFTEERLEPHEKVDMPVVFYVDPAVADDSELNGVESLRSDTRCFAPPNRQTRQICPDFFPTLLRTQPTAKNFSASNVRDATRLTATRSARCSAASSAAGPVRLPAIPIHRRLRRPDLYGLLTGLIGG